ncbi:MAG: hypothetical protein U5J82_01025, partial [Desulfobacterales bacterium]|nr:hypothetical protein [Desulfobacterales bacterium]
MAAIAFSFYTFSLLQTVLATAINVLAPFLTGLLLAYILAPAVVALQKTPPSGPSNTELTKNTSA